LTNDAQQNIHVAIRILNALAVNCVQPDSEDVRRLRNLAESEHERAMPIDELACDVICRERKRIALARLSDVAVSA